MLPVFGLAESYGGDIASIRPGGMMELETALTIMGWLGFGFGLAFGFVLGLVTGVFILARVSTGLDHD